MESLLGFKLDFWDYATFAVLMLLVLAGLITVVWLAGLPGRIAIARKHPDAEAVKMMGYAGFLAAVPWIQAFIWAFKPTDIVDIRRFPAQEAKGIDEEIARLSGKPVPTVARPDAKPAPAATKPPDAEPPATDQKRES
jgi:hypothetical protein